MDADEVLRAYDEQVRRSMVAPRPDWTAELVFDGRVLRVTSTPDLDWGCFVIWTDLDASNADQAIAEQVDYFGSLGRSFEWKWFGHDQPGDLRKRLAAAGFEPDEDESLVVGDTETVVDACATAMPPEGVVLRHVRTGSAEELDRDMAGIEALNLEVWGDDMSWLTTELRKELEQSPDELRIHVAEAGDEIVCAAWVRFHTGTDFASLWGGSTLPAWRRKGIYRSLVGRRAIQARDRGFRYLQVDASPDSRPVLEQLGLRVLTTTTPYNWKP